MVKRLIIYFLTTVFSFSWFGCDKKATSEQLKDYEIVTKTNKIFESHNYTDFQKVCLDIIENVKPFYVVDYKTDNISIDYEKIFKEKPEIIEQLTLLKEQHEKNYKDIVPGTEDCNYWMKKYKDSHGWIIRTAYEINEKGKYNKNKRIHINYSQYCPFCEYIDKQFEKTGEIEKIINEIMEYD